MSNLTALLIDKILVLIVAVSCIIHAILMRNEKNGGSISFFGEDKEEVQQNVE